MPVVAHEWQCFPDSINHFFNQFWGKCRVFLLFLCKAVYFFPLFNETKYTNIFHLHTSYFKTSHIIFIYLGLLRCTILQLIICTLYCMLTIASQILFHPHLSLLYSLHLSPSPFTLAIITLLLSTFMSFSLLLSPFTTTHHPATVSLLSV